MKKKNVDKQEMEKVLKTISMAKAKNVRGGSNLQANKLPVNIGISLYIIISFFTLPLYMSAQEIKERNDSVLIEKSDVMIKNPVDINFKAAETIGIENMKLNFDYVPETRAFTFSNPVSVNVFSPFLPYHYSEQNFMEGFTLQGIQNRFAINDFLYADLNFYISSQYYGIFQPTPYVNAHARLNLILKLHDRVQVVGMGQISAREGLNPKIPSTIVVP